MNDVVLTQVKSCTTCRHGYSKVRCDGCLENGTNPHFAYRHWEEGDPEGDLRRMELSGARDIHINGEADVNVGWTPAEARRKLFKVACACGYMVGALRSSKGRPGCAEVTITTHEGTWAVCYQDGRLVYIDRIRERDDARIPFWDRADLEKRFGQ